MAELLRRSKTARRAVRGLLVYACCLTFVALVYRQTPITFFHTETGEWLRIAHSPAAAQQKLVREFWTTSSHGHYTPLAFTLEFLFTKYADTRSLPWKTRQIAALALVAATLFAAASAIARRFQLMPLSATALSAAVAIAFVCQPLMREMIGWPFHVFQVLWLALTFAAIHALVWVAEEPGRWHSAFAAAGISYASIHVLGLGLITAVAMAAVLALLLLAARTGRLPSFASAQRNLAAALLALLVLTALHAACMYFLIGAPHAPIMPTAPFRFAHALGLVAIYPVTAAAAYFGLLAPSFYELPLVVQSAAPFGAALIIVAALFWTASICLAVSEADPGKILASLLAAFTLVVGLGFFAMFAMRERYEIGSLDLDLYKLLVDARYVLTFDAAPVILVTLVAVLLARRAQVIATVVAVIVIAAALVSHFCYERDVRPKVLANNSISHADAWNAIVQMSKQCEQAALPIPDLPVEALVPFSTTTRLSYFEPILHDHLGMRSSEHCRFTDWQTARQNHRDQYIKAAPALVRVVKLLRLSW